MLSFIKRLFGNRSLPSNESKTSPETNQFQKPIFSKTVACITLNREEEAPQNQWYRRDHWQSDHFLRIDTSWDQDWKVFEAEEQVTGVAYDSRTIDFLKICDQPQFKIFLEKEPSNKHDPNAIKVMCSATIEDELVVKQIGYLSKHTSLQLKDEKELEARPYSAYLPVQGHRFGLRIRVLVRSQKYRKKHYGESATPAPIKVQWKPEPWTKQDDENLEEIYEYFADKDFREDYCIKKPAKKIIKEAAMALHEMGILSSNLSLHIDRVVEMIIEINPNLEIEL
jgi:hypothetical protein